MYNHRYVSKKKQEEREADLSFLATIIAATLALLLLVMVAPIPGLAAERQTVKSGPLKIVQKGHTAKLYWRGEKYDQYKGIKKMQIVPEKKLKIRTLRTRKNRVLLVEKIIGAIKNRRLDGITSCGNYICYERLRGYVKPGDIVVTYCVYNPYTRYIDDIVHRFDFIKG